MHAHHAVGTAGADRGRSAACRDPHACSTSARASSSRRDGRARPCRRPAPGSRAVASARRRPRARRRRHLAVMKQRKAACSGRVHGGRARPPARGRRARAAAAPSQRCRPTPSVTSRPPPGARRMRSVLKHRAQLVQRGAAGRSCDASWRSDSSDQPAAAAKRASRPPRHVEHQGSCWRRGAAAPSSSRAGERWRARRRAHRAARAPPPSRSAPRPAPPKVEAGRAAGEHSADGRSVWCGGGACDYRERLRRRGGGGRRVRRAEEDEHRGQQHHAACSVSARNSVPRRGWRHQSVTTMAVGKAPVSGPAQPQRRLVEDAADEQPEQG